MCFDVVFLYDYNMLIYTCFRVFSPSSYELKANLSLASITVKTGGNSEYWPFPIEIHRGQDVIHASFSTMKERTTLMECVGRHTGDSPAGVARVRANDELQGGFPYCYQIGYLLPLLALTLSQPSFNTAIRLM